MPDNKICLKIKKSKLLTQYSFMSYCFKILALSDCIYFYLIIIYSADFNARTFFISLIHWETVFFSIYSIASRIILIFFIPMSPKLIIMDRCEHCFVQ